MIENLITAISYVASGLAMVWTIMLFDYDVYLCHSSGWMTKLLCHVLVPLWALLASLVFLFVIPLLDLVMGDPYAPLFLAIPVYVICGYAMHLLYLMIHRITFGDSYDNMCRGAADAKDVLPAETW